MSIRQNKIMKQLSLILFIGLTLMSCQKELKVFVIDSNFDCLGNNVELVFSENCCDITPNFLTCEIIEVPDINTLDADHVSILPGACLEVNGELVFSSGDEVTKFILRDKKHFLLREILAISCTGLFESASYIEQSNEVVELAYQNEVFGLDTLYIKLKTAIFGHEGQIPDPKIDRYSILHRKSFTNIANFYVLHTVGASGFDSQHKTFHESITLNNQIYSNVVEFKLRANSQASPHTRLYVSDELGFFGFEKDQKVWLKL